MNKHDRIRFRHMIDAGREAALFAETRKRADLDHDRMLALALIKSIEIIGEAASKISFAFRENHPEIPRPALWACATNPFMHTFRSILMLYGIQPSWNYHHLSNR